MKHYALVRFAYNDCLVLPLEKAAALLELINSVDHRFEYAYNYGDDHKEENHGTALVPRKSSLEIGIVNDTELTEHRRRGLAEYWQREEKIAARKAAEAQEAGQ